MKANYKLAKSNRRSDVMLQGVYAKRKLFPNYNAAAISIPISILIVIRAMRKLQKLW